MNGKQKFYLLIAFFQVLLIAMVFFTVNGVIGFATAQTGTSTLDFFNSPTTVILAISAAAAVGISVLASAWTIRTVGTAAISSLSEREESFFKAFLIVALGEALAVYGLIVAILLWTKIPAPV